MAKLRKHQSAWRSGARVAAHTQLGKLRLGECRLPSQSRTGKAAENLQFSKLGFCPLQHAVCPWTISVGNLAVTPQTLALKHVCLFPPTWPVGKATSAHHFLPCLNQHKLKTEKEAKQTKTYETLIGAQVNTGEHRRNGKGAPV